MLRDLIDAAEGSKALAAKARVPAAASSPATASSVTPTSPADALVSQHEYSRMQRILGVLRVALSACRRYTQRVLSTKTSWLQMCLGLAAASLCIVLLRKMWQILSSSAAATYLVRLLFAHTLGPNNLPSANP